MLPEPGTIFKDDYFARTSFTIVDGQPAVVKESKPWRLLGLPIKLPARLLKRHEANLHRRLSTIRGIPELIDVADDQLRLIRRYVAGATLQAVPRVSGEFFDELEAIVRELHENGVAYVDLAKEENIIVGEDGHPYLIDFQVSMVLGPFQGLLKPVKARVFRVLAREDLYHLAKHRSLKAPDSLRFEHGYLLANPSLFNRAHRTFVKTIYNLVTRRLWRVRRGPPRPRP